MSEEVNVAAEVETGETEAAEKVEKGVQGRTQRDMQNVTEVVEERAVLDIRKIDNAIDKLVKIREMDTKRTAVKFTPKNNLSLEDVNYFMEKTGEDKGKSERFLDEAGGDLKGAFKIWLHTAPGLDYDSFCRDKL